MESIKLSRQKLSKAVHASNTKLLPQFGMPRVKVTLSGAASMSIKPMEREVPHVAMYKVGENLQLSLLPSMLI